MGFGFLALGYFMALAFTGGRANNSGSGVGGGFLAGFLGGISSTLVQGKELKDTLSKLFKDDDDDDNTPKKDKDDNTPKKGDDDDDVVDFGLDDEEDDSESVEVQRGKALAMMQKQVASATPENSEKIVNAYNAMIGCMYDDTGELLSPEKIEENMEKLKKEDKDLFSDIQKAVLESSKDKSVLDAFKESTKEISYGEAKAAYEIAAAQHVENKKKEAAENLKDERDDKITSINSDTNLSKEEKEKEIAKLETEYEKKIKDSNDNFDKIIKIHNDKANELKDAKPTSLKNDPEIQQQLKEYNDLKDKKEILGGDKGFDYVKNKYKNFDLAQFNKGDLTDPNLDKEKQDALDAYLKENDIDKNTLISVLAIQGAKDEKERKKLQDAADNNIRKQHTKEWDKVKKDKDAKEQQLKKLIEKKKQAKATGSTPKDPEPKDPKEPDPKDPKEPEPKQVIKTVSGFEPKEGDKEWYPEIDENGDVTDKFAVAVVKEKDDEGNEVLHYVMRDADGEEVEIDKSDFEEHKSKYNDFKEELNPDDEEKLDELLDPEHQESEDEKNSEEGKSAERDKDGKRVNPAKIWHKKKNRQTGKSSKNYYNKSGASCTPEEYHKKIENYKKYVQAHKKQQPKESITDFLSDRLIVEEFYPTDITQYLKTFFD